MSEEEIKAALSIEIESNFDMCGYSDHTVKLLWNGEVISKDSVELYDDN